ncbi:protein SRC2-like [Lycium barbarum]|uniref:protein SRC2-like n=1 Tax=Lycium barbarum TaxID=112863 RepID=UPI00293E0111|nr:protein SRC2-like [Lycium barbarum]
MELRPLDIKIISAENIKNVNTFSKMDVYAEVSIPSYYTIAAHKQKTFIDKNSGTNPKWNHSMKFTLDESSLTKPGLYVIICLKSERTLGDREIDEVSGPINDLFNQSTSDGTTERFVEYPVITESGKPKGTLKFSYEFGEKFTAPEQKRDVYHEPVTAYPAPMHGNSYPGVAYNEQHPGYGYPPAHQAGYPPAGYPPQAGAPGYGYPPQQPGYGYPPVQPGYPPVQPPKRNNNFGGMGLLNGLLIGDMVLDVGEICSW